MNHSCLLFLADFNRPTRTGKAMKNAVISLHYLPIPVLTQNPRLCREIFPKYCCDYALMFTAHKLKGTQYKEIYTEQFIFS